MSGGDGWWLAALRDGKIDGYLGISTATTGNPQLVAD